MGLCAALEGHAWSAIGPLITPEPLNFLEGDPTTVVDGTSLRGTGTEDVFDNIFYFQGAPVVTPFVQVWGIDKARGKASACRWNAHGTELDFSSTLDAKLEIGAGVPSLLDRYRTVAFLYRLRHGGRKKAAANENGRSGVYRSGRCQSLVFVGDVGIEPTTSTV